MARGCEPNSPYSVGWFQVIDGTAELLQSDFLIVQLLLHSLDISVMFFGRKVAYLIEHSSHFVEHTAVTASFRPCDGKSELLNMTA